ncbi:hypothetical protein CMI45_00915 [Candidatus Pacearchaeota archaeon]|nr:hypothetical protein [Candidatus Pacearchaeota archaeon]|tara:strand:- start:1521 stop:2099 length:579 start_codon:yes stop_codon:yes gene_type:complete
MDIDKVIEKRISIRGFKKKKVPFGKVLDAISSALQGPFAGNFNNLKFLIIESPDTIKQISKNCQQTWISESPLIILVCTDDSHLERIYGERGRVYSRQQAGAAISTLQLKLTDLNIDSCWVGSYSDDLLKQVLEIPQHIQIEAVIPAGYSSKERTKPKKKELETVLYWETWENDKRPAIFKETPEEKALRSE